MPEKGSMSDRQVWETASKIASEFGDDDAEQFAERLFEILRDTTSPEDRRRMAAAVDVIAGGAKH